MNLNLFLLQLVSLTCVVMLLQVRRLSRGWFGKLITLLAVLLGGLLVNPRSAGLISGAAWIVLIVLPLIGFASVSRLVSQERYGQARKIAAWLRWLHPADGYVEYPELLKALELGQQGKLNQAEQIFDRYQSHPTSIGRLATVLFYRLNARWNELQRWANSMPERILYQEQAVGANYIRSLGETGDLNGLLASVEQFEQRLGQSGNLTLNLLRLYALSFCGEVEPVQQMLDRSSSLYAAATRRFWLATAEMAAGQQTIARDRLQSLSNQGDVALNHALTNAIRWRLSQPVVNPGLILTPSSQRILTQIKTSLWQEARYSHHVLTTRRSVATYTLIAINLLAFAVEMVAGGTEDLETLYKLGAMVPDIFWAGEWWRSISALFLHAGLLHLAANMLGLYFFGRLVESVLGSKKFLICYFLSGIGSMLVIAVLPLLFQVPLQVTVGASGAVMGLVGAEAAILLQGWRLEKARIARDRLKLLGLAMALQVLSDLLTPQVSFGAHISGLMLGFTAGNVLFRVGGKRARSNLSES